MNDIKVDKDPIGYLWCVWLCNVIIFVTDTQARAEEFAKLYRGATQ